MLVELQLEHGAKVWVNSELVSAVEPAKEGFCIVYVLGYASDSARGYFLIRGTAEQVAGTIKLAASGKSGF